jgi:hypothetical protein
MPQQQAIQSMKRICGPIKKKAAPKGAANRETILYL